MLPAPTVPVPPTPWQNLVKATLPPPVGPGGPPWDAASVGAAAWSAGTTVESAGAAVVVSTGAAVVVSTGAAAVVSAGTVSAQALIGSPASASTAIERMGTMTRFTQTSPINPPTRPYLLRKTACRRGCQAMGASDYHLWRPSHPGA